MFSSVKDYHLFFNPPFGKLFWKWLLVRRTGAGQYKEEGLDYATWLTVAALPAERILTPPVTLFLDSVGNCGSSQ